MARVLKMQVTDMVELSHRTHEVVDIEFLEFEPGVWAVNVEYGNDNKNRRLVGVHEGQSRTWTNLGRAVASIKDKLKIGNKRFNNYRLTVFNSEADP
jgi:hypothetical protein